MLLLALLLSPITHLPSSTPGNNLENEDTQITPLRKASRLHVKRPVLNHIETTRGQLHNRRYILGCFQTVQDARYK